MSTQATTSIDEDSRATFRMGRSRFYMAYLVFYGPTSSGCIVSTGFCTSCWRQLTSDSSSPDEQVEDFEFTARPQEES